MTAQIIDLAERREVIRRQRNDPFAISLIWPGIFLSCAAFWFLAGALAVQWAHGTLSAHG